MKSIEKKEINRECFGHSIERFAGEEDEEEGVYRDDLWRREFRDKE